MKDVPMVMVLLLFFKVWSSARTSAVQVAYRHVDLWMDSPETTKTFPIDGLPNFLRAPLVHLWRIGALLKTSNKIIMKSKQTEHAEHTSPCQNQTHTIL